MSKLSPDLLTHGAFLTLIGPYKISGFDWSYPEAPRDDRIIENLRRYDPDLCAQVLTRSRTHGGNAAMRDALSRFNHSSGCVPMTKWSPDNITHYLAAAKDVSHILADIPEKAGIHPLSWYQPTSSSSGLPLLKPKNEVHEESVAKARKLFNHIRFTKGKKFKEYLVPPVIPFVKAVPAPIGKHSTRGVWGFPYVITLLESMFATPIYSLLKKYLYLCDLPFIFGRGAFRSARSFTNKFHSAIASLDWVKGDTQPLADKLRIAFDQMEELLDFSKYGGNEATSSFSDDLRRVWAYVKWYFINTPIVFNDFLYRKEGKIPSGSMFTMLMWLFMNLNERGYLIRKVEGRSLSREDAVVGGDDGLSSHSDSTSFEDLIEAAREIGTNYHPLGKSHFYQGAECQKAVTLSTCFDEPLKLKRDEIDLFARCCMPPRWVPTIEEAVARVVTISLSVCKTNTRLNAYADHCLDIPGLDPDRELTLDRDYMKYFKYVFDTDLGLYVGKTTLRKLGKIYFDDIMWTFLAMRL